MEKSNKISIINNFWWNYLWCSTDDFQWNWIKVISHSPDLVDSKEVYILVYWNWKTIVSVMKQCKNEIIEIIDKYWINREKIHSAINKIYDWEKKFTWIIITSYLFSKEQLKPKNPQVRHINKNEIELYTDFMKKCEVKDISEIFMDFKEPFQEFYWYFEWNQIVAISNYIVDDENDKIAHIWILVRSDKKWKWYWKILANDLSHEILERNLIPQYRVWEENIASRKIAESLWYEEVLRGYSLRIR